MRSVNPATGETIREYPDADEAAVEAAVARSAAAFADYRRTDFASRAGWLAQAATLLEDDKDGLARLIVEEMGKPLTAAGSGSLKACFRACSSAPLSYRACSLIRAWSPQR